MLFIVEIGLVVAAWRKGWRGLALMPLGITLGLAFLIGGAVGASGGSIEDAIPVLLLVDFACIGVLIGMVVRAPKGVQPMATFGVKTMTGASTGSANA